VKAKDVASRLLGSRLIRYGFVGVALCLGGYAISRQWAEIQRALDRIGPLAAVGALLAVLGMQFTTLGCWRALLAGLGSPLPTRAAGRILFIGQLGKYLPGSVWPVLAQMELGTGYRVPRASSGAASLLCMLLSLLTGLVTALVTLPFATGSTGYAWAFLAVPVLAACLCPKVLNPLLRQVFRLARRPPLAKPLTGSVLATAIAWSFAAWAANGLQIWLLATRLGAPPGQAVALSIGGYAFAWCAGFLVILAPAGAGIREVLLVAALSPVLGTGAATAVALVSRAVTAAGDVIVAGLAAARPAGLG
jgi:glycosyltransferase 2 family protein